MQISVCVYIYIYINICMYICVYIHIHKIMQFYLIVLSPNIIQFYVWVREIPLEEGMAAYSSILAWRIPWIEEPGGLQSIELHRISHDWIDLACIHQRSGITRSYGSSICNFGGKLHVVFQIDCTNLHSHLQCMGVPISPHPCQDMSFLIIAILTGVKHFSL